MHHSPFATTDIVEFASQLAREIAPWAAAYDRDGTFAFESVKHLQAQGYGALTVPVAYGGMGAGLLELCKAQERLAVGDAAVALAFGMSLIKIGQQAAKRTWPMGIYDEVMRAAGARGALLNSVATEPALGSPSRGGKPETVAVPAEGGGWRITGHKTWCSLAPVLEYIIVTATIADETEDVGRFMVRPGAGVTVIETWDSMAMRATGSHDMRFENVYVAAEDLLGRGGVTGKGGGTAESEIAAPDAYFSLPIAAVYLGVAVEAQRAAVEYARNRVPTALGKPLTTVEGIRAQLATSEGELQIARTLLHDAARRVEASAGEWDDELRLAVYLAKQTVTNNAISVVNRAMRVVGGAALARGNPLERAYRNVRAGLSHPPGDDMTGRALATYTIDRVTGDR